jgi:AcrR family transcriptional regulator
MGEEEDMAALQKTVVPFSTKLHIARYSLVPGVSRKMVAATHMPAPPNPLGSETNPRDRILEAAFTAFLTHGYAATSTLEIATRARVSKRELYGLVGNKQEMLVACITDRARRLQVPADLPVPRDRHTLEQVLTAFGEQLVREISDPAVIGVFRLAIAEAVHAPEVARALDSIGRDASRAALRQIMAQAEVAGLVVGQPSELAQQFNALLLSDLLMSLLLGVAERPAPRAIQERSRAAARALLQLHAPSVGAS